MYRLPIYGLNLLITVIILCGTFLFAQNSAPESSASTKPQSTDWQKVNDYWAGAAEVSRYELQQERYGVIRKGDAVLIFVREPFLQDRHVKDERGRGNFQILKMNATRNFLTGVYPYHTMVSVFQPLKEEVVGEALKVTTSVQEWCGHVFMQSNRREGMIKTSVQSYFEQEEGGVFESAEDEILEDEIWTSIRLNPLALPTGKVRMIPGSLYTRFAHRQPVAEDARAQWIKGSKKDTVSYQIKYLSSKRFVEIEIQAQQPYEIESWTEGREGGAQTTAKLTNRLRNFAYWEHNDRQGESIRSKLGL